MALENKIEIYVVGSHTSTFWHIPSSWLNSRGQMLVLPLAMKLSGEGCFRRSWQYVHHFKEKKCVSPTLICSNTQWKWFADTELITNSQLIYLGSHFSHHWNDSNVENSLLCTKCLEVVFQVHLLLLIFVIKITIN